MTRNGPTNASKGYSEPPESIPMVSRTFHFRLIFGRFEPGSLSTFSKSDLNKSQKSPFPGPPRQEPWGCIPGLSDMETDRPLEIGNLRRMFAWGEHFPQIANRPCSVCRGAPLSANPACAATSRGDYRICEVRIWKKVLREPGSNRPKIRRKSKVRETVGIDSGGPE